ncbi:putative metallophosphoesterase [Quercus suber]|uniref:Metallophosphoesterase n=1 Tax=Quercus suber TaxID=58331 RepID=A0AAW0KD24_QUESU
MVLEIEEQFQLPRVCWGFGKMGTILTLMMLLCLCLTTNSHEAARVIEQKQQQEQEESERQGFSSKPNWNNNNNNNNNSRRVIDVKGGPESVVWVVQLSDLHFSVHNPDRALDFNTIVGPALSMINPSLVLITGDLTDGKSKDLLTMKQNEEEWVEYQNTMEDVIKRSGLDKNIFFDLRGNHDNFGVPAVGGSFDFFSKYSINGQLGRHGNVNSVTLQTGEQKHLFVGFDSTMSFGLRGPTNLFGHPTDQLLAELDLELSQWNSHSIKPVTKISFGHFPLSFSASSNSGKSLKDIFLKHSLSAYLCGHLHTRFGKNLKRHHQSIHHFLSLPKLLQFNIHQMSSGIRALVFSASPIVSVMARIFDTLPGNLYLVWESSMTKLVDNTSRGDLYTAPWNYKAFEDPSPDRYWLQIEVTDILGRSTLTELRPFSVNGLSAKLSWTWKEFSVMGCQWAALYNPILWSTLYFIFFILLTPKALLIYSKKQYTFKTFIANKGFINGIAWVLQELCRVPILWYGMLGYLLHLIFLPWFSGLVFSDGKDREYMTYMGWVVKSSDGRGKHEYVGFPDNMVVVLPHLFFVVLPSILVIGFLAAERVIYREYFLSLSGKKEDDFDQGKMSFLLYGYQGIQNSKFHFGKRWIRKLLLVVCLAICWMHFKSCIVLVKAYEMNPLIHFPGYSFSIPLLLAYAVYKSRNI